MDCKDNKDIKRMIPGKKNADFTTKASGFVHATTRQGLEIPFIRFEYIPKVEEELRLSGLETGTSGSRLRTTTYCPGNNWCRSGLVNTFSL